MRLSLILPALGLHQLALSDDLYRILGTGFMFLATDKIESGRFGVNYEELALSREYVIRMYESEDSYKRGQKIIDESDFIIIGSASKGVMEYAYKNDKALILRYSERLFKKGAIRRFIPSVKKRILEQFVFSRKKFVVLCSSAFLPSDLRFFKSHHMTLKWGYFPEIQKLTVDDLRQKQHNDCIQILWAGRYLPLKRPFDAIALAEQLKKHNYRFRLDFFGDGELKKSIQNKILKKDLNDCVFLHESVSTNDLFQQMKSADLFLFTSDYHEGWGAVLNEAMNAGCVCLCSHAPGSVPFVIEDGKNGFVYKCGDVEELFKKTRLVMEDSVLREQIAINAYKTIQNQWNHTNAAERLVKILDDYKKTGIIRPYPNGVLSEATIINNDWYKEKTK